MHGLRERWALQVFHDDVGGALVEAIVVDRDRVRVLDLAREARLALEPLTELWIQRVQYLHSHGPTEPLVPRLVDRSHASLTDPPQDLVSFRNRAADKRVDAFAAVPGEHRRRRVRGTAACPALAEFP